MNIKTLIKYLAKRGFYFYHQGLMSPRAVCFLSKKDNHSYSQLQKCFPYSKKLSLLQLMSYYNEKTITIKRTSYAWYFIRKYLILFGCNCTFIVSMKSNPLIIESKNSDYVFMIAPIMHDEPIANAKGEEVWYKTTKEGFKIATGCVCPALIEKKGEVKYNPEENDALKRLQIAYLRKS